MRIGIITTMIAGCTAYAGAGSYSYAGPAAPYPRAYRAPYKVESGVVVLAEPPSPSAAEASNHCFGVAPICHLTQAPLCVCTTPDWNSCRWMCVSEASPPQ